MIYRPKRVDGNQGEIVRLWQRLGVLVTDTSRVGEGFPDTLLAFRGRLILAEIKRPKKGLNERQEKFHRQHEAHGIVIPIVRSMDDALELIYAKRHAKPC